MGTYVDNVNVGRNDQVKGSPLNFVYFHVVMAQQHLTLLTPGFCADSRSKWAQDELDALLPAIARNGRLIPCTQQRIVDLNDQLLDLEHAIDTREFQIRRQEKAQRQEARKASRCK